MSKTVDYSGCALECIRSNKERECIKTVKGVCPYCEAIAGEANERIQQLESRLAQVERERDAAVADIPHYCHLCRHNDRKSKHNAKRSPCSRCRTYDADGCFEWRGVCAENTEEDDNAKMD